MYDHPFQITKNIGNNALSFDQRKNPTLTVPSLIEGSLEDVKLGNEVVFEDIDENDELQSCKGLEHLVRFSQPETETPVVVVDNHNHVFYFWYEAFFKKQIERGCTLVHIDQHRDTRMPERNIKKEEAGSLEGVFHYTNFLLNVGNYIPPAMEEGLVSELISITSGYALGESQAKKVDRGLIVNIDLDFWAPELDYIDQTMSLNKTKAWMQEADLITIATSPFFIDQKRALDILHKLFN